MVASSYLSPQSGKDWILADLHDDLRYEGSWLPWVMVDLLIGGQREELNQTIGKKEAKKKGKTTGQLLLVSILVIS